MLRRIGFAAPVIFLLVITGSAMAARDSSCKGKRTCTTTTDSVPPGVSISSPGVGATVSGLVTVSGAAQDNVSVARVLVSVDGGSSQTANGSTNWSLGVDTAKLSDGSHTLTAVAVDGSGNMAATAESITVSNPAPASQPPADTTPLVAAPTAPETGPTSIRTPVVAGEQLDDVRGRVGDRRQALGELGARLGLDPDHQPRHDVVEQADLVRGEARRAVDEEIGDGGQDLDPARV